MIHLTLTHRSGRTPCVPAALRALGALRVVAHDTAYPGEREALQRKDFSTVPVCGSVRPLASQRALLERR